MQGNKHIIRAGFLSTAVNSSLRNVGLDVARGICVLLVVLAHTNNLLRAYTPVYRLLYPLGEMAQDLFFALSGYLIGGQILKMLVQPGFGGKEVFRFYKKRWIRTVPFYFLFLLINLLLFWFVYRPFGPWYLKADFNPLPYFVFFQNFFSRHPVFFPEIWPIPIEEWSYLLLPLPFLLFTAFFKKGNTFWRRLIYLVLLIVLIQGFRMVYISTHHPETDWELRKIVIYRLDALLYGFILALCVQHEKTRSYLAGKSKLLLGTGLLLLMASLFFNKLFTPDQYNMILFIYQPAACTLLLPFFIFKTFRPGAFAALFTHLSLTGYAVLLLHLYCLQFLFLTFFPPTGFLSAIGITVVYLIVLSLVSTLFYNFVERPVLLLRKG